MQHGWLRQWVLLGAIAVSSSLAAYVESRPCTDIPSDKSILPISIRAALSPRDNGQTLRIGASSMIKEAECNVLAHVIVNMTSEGLGWRVSNQLTTNTTCEAWPIAGDGAQLLRADATQDIYPSLLSTFQTRVELADNAMGQFGCAHVEITPELDPVTSRILRWVPCAILIFVFLYGAVDALYEHEPREYVIDGVRVPHTETRPILPLFGDCLQYLQFVFLSGCLTIAYPGFYRPAVSKLSWFSLFHSGPITHSLVYNGVRDGIYEVNGTYGGTFGLEIMHQIAATPGTMDTWFNMLVTILIIAACAGIILECLHLFRKPQPPSPGLATPQAASSLRRRLASLLRVVFSYFTMPLISMSCYQLANAAWLPRTHTIYAVFLILYLVALFSWLLYQVPARSLGRLLLNKSTQYQSLLPDDFPRHNEYDDVFIMVLFTLLFIRGIAIGGLQKWGVAQLTVLSFCELVLLGCIYLLKSHPLGSVVTIGSVVRLITVGFMFAFLPGISNTTAKTIIGRGILLLHAGMLVGGFFVPTAFRLGKLYVTRWKAPKPAVYSLRQLRRRQTSGTPPSPTGQGVLLDESGHRIGVQGSSVRHPPSGEAIPVNFYFRPPRSTSSRSSSHNMPTLYTRSPHEHATGLDSKCSPATSESPIEIHISSKSSQGSRGSSRVLHSPSGSSSMGTRSISSQSSDGGTVAPTEAAALVVPLNDYTTREADAYRLMPDGRRRVHEWGAPPSSTVPQRSLFADAHQLFASISSTLSSPFQRKRDPD